ncbi:hypothetical protein B296_00053665 [Ensete ventricosum]|uniref:Uncharacterized protein n=1 Tax=Ensete ventricosum TaxID=4639 RepID=A0A426XAP1_ENSVE|nr:hypothetical protein B296_00053665 [Ensete ventricosum]
MGKEGDSGFVSTGGGVSNHDNVAGRGRRGQHRGDVGEGDLGGRGGKGSGGKQGQQLLYRVMAQLGAAAVTRGETTVRASSNGGDSLCGPQGEMGKTVRGPTVGNGDRRWGREEDDKGSYVKMDVGKRGMAVKRGDQGCGRE